MTEPLVDGLLDAGERATTDEQDVGRVDLDVLLLGVFSAALRWDVGRCPFEHFQECLLHTFSRDVTSDRDVLARLADLVDLIDVEDAALGRFDIEVGRMQQLEQQVLHIFAHVARLGQRRRIANGERHVERAGKRLGEERLAAAGGTDEQDVRLVDFDIRLVLGRHQPLVVAVDGDGQNSLGRFLANHVLVEFRDDFPGRRDHA